MAFSVVLIAAIQLCRLKGSVIQALEVQDSKISENPQLENNFCENALTKTSFGQRALLGLHISDESIWW